MLSTRNITNGIFLFLFLEVWSGCTVHQSARQSVPLRKEVQVSAYGSFIQMTIRKPSGGVDKYAGELIGVRNDSIFAINETSWIGIPMEDCPNAIVIMFKNNAALTPLIGIGGSVISGIANGYTASISAPLWLIGAGTTGLTEAKRPNNFVYPYDPWESLIPFSRFPQGVPKSCNVASLTVREGARYRVQNYQVE